MKHAHGFDTFSIKGLWSNLGLNILVVGGEAIKDHFTSRRKNGLRLSPLNSYLCGFAPKELLLFWTQNPFLI